MENSHLLGNMQVFISVVDSGSFSESARRLGLSQPSISRQVNMLEESLGVRLLQRTTRRLSLTEAGQIYYDKARQIQRDVHEAGQSISGFKDKPSGLLRISAPYTWADVKITPWLAEFLTHYPDIKINIECNDRYQNIIEHQLDIVIRVGELLDSSYIAVPFGQVNFVLCATPSYIAQCGLPNTVSDLQNHNAILFEDFENIVLTEADQTTHHVTLTGSVCTNTVSVMLSAVQQHIGFGILPDLLIKPLLTSGELVNVMPTMKITIKNHPIDQIFALYSNRKHLPAKVRAFIDFFKPKFTAENH